MSNVVPNTNSSTEKSENIYNEGTAVAAKDKSGRIEKFYIEEAKNGIYRLRRDEKKGVDVLDMEFSEADVSEDPGTLGLSMGTPPVDNDHTGSRTARNDTSIG